MADEYWEPWQPQVGQGVRIRMSGECEWMGVVGSDLNTRMLHHTVLPVNGLTGIIYLEHQHEPSLKGHWWQVQLDERYVSGGISWGKSTHAAIELTTIEGQANGQRL